MCQIAAYEGLRVTASAAFLSDSPSNLTVMTESAVERVLFEGRKAVGVEVGGKTCKLMPILIQDACFPETSE